MPSLHLKNISDNLYHKLVKSAKLSRRSLSQEAIFLLESALSENDIEKNKERRRKVADEISKNRKLTQEEAKRAIQWIRNDRDRP